MTHENGKEHFLLFGILGIAFFGLVFVVHEASPVSALTEAEQDAIDDLEKEQKKKEQQKKAFEQIVDLKKRQGEVLSGQLATIETQTERLEREIRENQTALSEVERNLRDTEAGIAEKERFILREREILSGLIREYYAAISDGAHVLFSIGENDSFPMKREDWLSETSGRISTMLRSLDETKQALLSSKKDLDEKKTAADTLQSQLDQRNSYLEGARQNKTALLVKTQGEQQKYTKLVRTLEEELKDLENEINNLESGLIGSIDLGKIPKYKNGLLDYPVKKVSFSQGYGMTAYAKSGAYGGGPHNGVDFGLNSGTPVYAPLSGKVVALGSMTKNGRWYGYGRWIAIDHGNGLTTLYGHLSKQEVKKGEKVDAGERIGLSGNTGYSTGPHLHFSVFSSNSFKIVSSSKVSGISIPVGASVNPMRYLP